MLHLLCTLARLATTSVAGGAALSYNQLAGADPASSARSSEHILAGPLSSRPLGGRKKTQLQGRTGAGTGSLSNGFSARRFYPKMVWVAKREIEPWQRKRLIFKKTILG